MTDYFSQLPPFPRDHQSKQIWIDRLKALLTERDLEINDRVVDTVTLSQGTKPTQANWEAAYTAQTGKALPIPPAAQLIWFNTALGQIGGIFGSLTNSGGVVYQKQNRNAPNTVAAFGVDQNEAAVAVAYNLGQSASDHPSVVLTTTVACRFQLFYGLSVYYASGSGNVGINFLMNNINVGEEYSGVAAGRGLFETTGSGVIQGYYLTPVLEAGQYTIQALFGVTSGTLTANIGGDYGQRQLVAKALVS